MACNCYVRVCGFGNLGQQTDSCILIGMPAYNVPALGSCSLSAFCFQSCWGSGTCMHSRRQLALCCATTLSPATGTEWLAAAACHAAAMCRMKACLLVCQSRISGLPGIVLHPSLTWPFSLPMSVCRLLCPAPACVAWLFGCSPGVVLSLGSDAGTDGCFEWQNPVLKTSEIVSCTGAFPLDLTSTRSQQQTSLSTYKHCPSSSSGHPVPQVILLVLFCHPHPPSAYLRLPSVAEPQPTCCQGN